jgi:hypothetical protein
MKMYQPLTLLDVIMESASKEQLEEVLRQPECEPSSGSQDFPAEGALNWLGYRSAEKAAAEKEFRNRTEPGGRAQSICAPFENRSS